MSAYAIKKQGGVSHPEGMGPAFWSGGFASGKDNASYGLDFFAYFFHQGKK